MSKNKNQQDNIPNLKTMAVVLFFMGLITVYTILPDNMMALIGYSIVVGGALLYYVLIYAKQQPTQTQDEACTRLEALKAKMEADEVKLAETEKMIAQLEAEEAQIQEELEAASDITVERWQVLCGKIEAMAYAAKQGRQYKNLLTILSGKRADAPLSPENAAKAKTLYLAIYTNGLSTMKKQHQSEKKARADIKANIEKDIRQKKKKRRK